MLIFTSRMLGHMAHGALQRALGKVQAAPMIFRLWPVDLDVYCHMNNANYLRVAELCRWKQMALTGLAGAAAKRGWMFLIAEQTIEYRTPIKPFQMYRVRNEMAVVDDKWIHYHHYFEDETGSKQYAVINMRAVVKHTSGRTIRPSDILTDCPDLANWLSSTIDSNLETTSASASDQES